MASIYPEDLSRELRIFTDAASHQLGQEQSKGIRFEDFLNQASPCATRFSGAIRSAREVSLPASRRFLYLREQIAELQKEGQRRRESSPNSTVSNCSFRAARDAQASITALLSRNQNKAFASGASL